MSSIRALKNNSIPGHVFRAYDIRGVVGDDIDEVFAYHLGRAVGSQVYERGGRRLIVGRDCRLSGLMLQNALMDGICASGCDVVDIGMCPTPVGYWAIHFLDADGGVQVTGSHNPPEYNGFKMTLLGSTLHDQHIQALRYRMIAENYVDGKGTVKERPVTEQYVAALANNLQKPSRPLRVVVDAGNGTGGITAVPLFKRLGCEVISLYCEPDGRFPNHEADPTVEANLQDLRQAVLVNHADVGLAFDGDADRLGVIDRDGAVIFGDRLLTLLSRALLREVPGATIVGEVKCSKSLYDDIRAHGGRAVMAKTGHSYIKKTIVLENADLAGEMSGHIFYKHRYLGFDDAVYAAGRLLEILGDGEETITERLNDLPETFSTPEIRTLCHEETKFDRVHAVGERVRAMDLVGVNVIDIDGVRIEWSDGWGLLRASNTQALLVSRYEASTQRRLEEIQEFFSKLIHGTMT